MLSISGGAHSVIVANANRLFDGIRQVRLDPIVALLAIGSGRVVALHDLGQLLLGAAVRDVVKRIVPYSRGFANGVLEAVNPDSDDSHPVVPRLDDLIVDPLPIRRVCPDKNDGAGSAVHLVGDPTLDCIVSATSDRFPIVVGRWLVSLNRSDVAYRRGTPVVRFVVKAVERSSCHIFITCC